MPEITPMMKQYLSIKEQYQDAILMYRMGDFYEMFYDDALDASKILGITLTTRDKGKKDPVPMCGVPVKSASGYVSRLVHSGKKVAICEQTESALNSKGLVQREVVQVITPGLVLDDQVLDNERPNYVMALCPDKKTGRYGIAFLDISTGDFRVTEAKDAPEAINEIERINPSEILVFEDIPEVKGFFVTIMDKGMDEDMARKVLVSHFKSLGIEGLGISGYPSAVVAAAMIIEYARSNQKGALRHITGLRFYNTGNYMHLGPNTVRNLELFEPLAGEGGKSLLEVINMTVTPMGSRKLRDWLSFPLMDPLEIENRLDAVEILSSDTTALQGIRKSLKSVLDLERIIARVSANRAGPRDVLALGHGLEIVPHIKDKLDPMDASLLRELKLKLDPLGHVSSKIRETLVDDPPHRVGEGMVIADGVNADLDDLRSIRRDSRSWIASLEAGEKKRTGITSLKIGYNKVFGYYIEVTKANIERVPDNYIRKQTLSNVERFITPELKEYEAKLLGAEERIKKLEMAVFDELNAYIAGYTPTLRDTADALATVDVLASLASVSLLNNYTRPKVYRGRGIDILSGRHPVVEKVLRPGEFVPNNCRFDGERDTVHIITGPNMAGKSTYMRQVALIVILAQMGSFVPANSATIGITDRIFTRIGALDNLSAGRSTFLVEMSETADIINNATSSSLVILDEIGRGTSTFDGMSIAWAVAEYLDENRVRTFFATHYHELSDLARRHRGIKNFHIAVEDTGPEIVFLRELRRGATGKSYGIHVARLAGVPDSVVANAQRILSSLGKKAKSPSKIALDARDTPTQLPLFSTQDSSILEELKDLDLEDMRPIDALNYLYSLKERLKK